MATLEQLNSCVLSAYPVMYQADEAFCLSPSSSLGTTKHWRIKTAAGLYCLHAWPKEDVQVDRLQFVQAVLWQAVQEGAEFVPLPIETSKHKGFVEYDKAFWQLLPWVSGNEGPEFFEPNTFPTLNGEADTERGVGTVEKADDGEWNGDEADEPSRIILENARANSCDLTTIHTPVHTPEYKPEHKMFQVVSAMLALAQFHQAVASFPLPNAQVSTFLGIRDDLAEWEKWISGKLSALYQALRNFAQLSSDAHEVRLAQAGFSLLHHVSRLAGNRMVILSRAARMAAPVQPVVGNACRRHCRFDEDGVCGTLDLTAIAVDSVALDVATLLGSLAENDAMLWQLGLKAYMQHRPLSDDELYLLEAFDRSRPILEGLGYLSRHFLLREKHNRFQVVEMCRRLEKILLRLEGEHRNWKTA